MKDSKASGEQKPGPKKKKKQSKSNLHPWYSLILPILLFGLFLVSLQYDNSLRQYIHTHSSRPAPIVFEPAQYPTLVNSATPLLSAQSAIVLDNDSKIILFSKNPRAQEFPASTTKIMTSLVALSYFKLNDVLTVKTGAEGSIVGFFPGEEVSFHDLLYAMLLPSGNDAALAIADNYPGGRSAFVAAMNEWAHTYHLDNTHFVDPDGLEDSNYTTALDLARLAAIGLDNPVIKQIVATKETVISNLTHTAVYPIANLNKLLGTYGVNGIKTGYTDKAGQVLTTSKDENGHTIIIVVMQSDDRFADTTKLLQMLTGHVTFVPIAQ